MFKRVPASHRLFINLKIISLLDPMEQIVEKPLKEWIHVEGSKITLKDSLQIPSQLLKIFFNYDLRPLMTVAPRQVHRFSYRLRASLNLL